MKIYADNAATTRMSQAAIDTMLDCMNNVYGNPSSLYTLGQKAKERLEETREEIAKIINAETPSRERSSLPRAAARQTTRR